MVAGYYEQFKRGSENHSVRMEGTNIAIAPVDSADRQEALERFQTIARAAVGHEGEGYEILIRVYRGRLATLLTLKPLT